MKFRSSIILASVIFFTCVFTGCNKKEDDPEEPKTNEPVAETLEVNVATILFGEEADATGKTFNITSNAEWTVTKGAADTWLTVSPTSGSGNSIVTVTVVANEGAAKRNGTVTVTTTGNLTKTVTVEQGGTDPYISAARGEGSVHPVPAAGGTVSVVVEASNAWTASIFGVEPEWLTIEPTSGNRAGVVTVTFDPNTEEEERDVHIVFKLTGTEEEETVTLTQDAYVPSISIGPEEDDEVSYQAQSITIDVNATDGWSVTIDPPDDWVTEGTHTDTKAVFNVERNAAISSRVAVITFTLDDYPEKTAEFTLTQDAYVPSISIDPEEDDVYYQGAQGITVNVDATDDWTATIDVNWVTLDSETSTQAVFNVAQNTDPAQRVAVITFTLDDYPEVAATFTLTQGGFDEPTIEINPASREIGPNGGNVTIAVTANRAWEVEIPGDATWVTKGTQTNTQSILIVASGATAQRTTNITFKLTEEPTVTRTLVLTQNETAEWIDVTGEVGLKNTGGEPEPFFRYGAAVTGAYHVIEDWITNASVANGGNVHNGQGVLSFYHWDGLSYYVNGKLYQTVHLNAGKYRFEIILNQASTAGYTAFALATITTNDEGGIPNIVDGAVTGALGYIQIPATMTPGQKIYYEFDLNQAAEVSLGFVVNISSYRACFYVRQVQLFEYR